MQAFAERQAHRWPGEDQSEAIFEVLWREVRLHGMGPFNGIVAKVEALHAQYMAQTDRDRRGRRPSLGINMDDLVEIEELPVETYGYH